ncbi:hypothetical protein BDV93DRAFT_517555 [Ceratobasidium sp. AG-I]|nr:hypothetical protein BDV93DRAFT_517555 [Ceratobasidium sp. AG-I]
MARAVCPPTATRAPAPVRLAPPNRHSPYGSRQSSTQSLPGKAVTPSSSFSHSSARTSRIGASLGPTVSMFEEFEVEGLLEGCASSSRSMNSIYTSCISELRGGSLDYRSAPASGSSQSLRPKASSNPPLSREWSTATTVLEFPNGPNDPSYGEDSSLFGSFTQEPTIDAGLSQDDSWVDATPILLDATVADATFRQPLDEDCDSDDMDEATIPSPLSPQDSVETVSRCSSHCFTDNAPSSPEDTPRRRIWEARPEEYVPRPQGAPARSVASVLEIGMQWERAQQSSDRTRNPRLAGAVGRIRRLHGDGQYMN